jgi:hypothetical protein
MRHGDIRPRVISSVFALRRFTVPALCQESGLTRSQTYPILVNLEENGFVRKERLENDARTAHRPLNFYWLSDEVAKKKVLLDEIAPFLRAAEAAFQEAEPESLLRVRETLNAIVNQLEELGREADDRFRSRRNSLEVDRIKEMLRSVSQGLELSLVEFGVTEEKVPPVIETEIQRFEKAKSQLLEIESRVGLVQRRLEAEKCSSNTLRKATAFCLAVAGEPTLNSRLSSAFASCYSPGQRPVLIELVAKMAKHYLEQSKNNHSSFQLNESILEDEYNNTSNLEFKTILSAIETDLNSALRKVERAGSPSGRLVLFWTLAQLAIRYAGDADTTLLAANLLENSVDKRSGASIYNSLNLCLLAGNTEQAFSRWREMSDEFGMHSARSLTQPSYPALLLAVAPAALLNQRLFDKLEDALGVSCSWSIISPLRLPAIAANPFVVEPTLCNPLEVSERIRISDSLRIHAPDLYIYGPIENSVRGPGVPQVALATGLATLGVPRVDAWEFAGGFGQEKVLVVVNSGRALQEPTMHRLGEFLRVLFDATHHDRSAPILVSTGRQPTKVLAKEGKPVLYDFDGEGKLRDAFTVTKELATCANE